MMDRQLWLILSAFLAGYCTGEPVRLMEEICAYRRARGRAKAMDRKPER
jgi:hypothetical protein